MEVVPDVELGTEIGIYTITHRETGRCYVGQSVNMPHRWHQHRSALRRNEHHAIHLQRAWCLYGDDAFDFHLVENCHPDDLTEREQWWMDELLPVFNTCPAAGSTRGITHSAETRAKISAALTGRTLSAERTANQGAGHVGLKHSSEARARMSVVQRGHLVSPETKAKISAAKMGKPGRPHSDETKAKMSAASKGKPKSVEHRAKMGRKLSPEDIAAMAAGRARAKAERDQDKMELCA